MPTDQPPHIVTRRDAFRWMGLSSAAIALGGSRIANAQTAPATVPVAQVQGSGFYRQQIGAFEVTVLSDGGFPFGSITQTFGLNADKAAVEQALADAFIAPDKAFGQVNALFIKGAGGTILVDTGVGRLFGPSTGFMLENLARAGHQPGDITHIIFTHLHPDHVGGALDAKDAAVFPKATVFYHKAEAAFWTAAKPDFSKSSMPAEMQKMATDRARKTIETYKSRTAVLDGPRASVVPGITLFHTPGHTPGHVTVEITSQGDRLVYIGDLAHHFAISFPHPEWHLAYDTDRDAGAAMRKQAYNTLASERLLVSGSHLPFPAMGHLRKRAEDSYDWVPAQWLW